MALEFCIPFITEFCGMKYKKFRASQLFDGYRLLDNQHVLVTTESGVIEGIITAAEAGEDVQELDGRRPGALVLA